MDFWRPQPAREDSQPHDRKRTFSAFSEMSETATLPSSRRLFISPSPPRRRPSLFPHNRSPIGNRSSTRPRRSPERSMSHLPRPSLEHRASQTIIDLTEDSDSPPPRALVRPAPRLARSDAIDLDNVIDLTDEPDVEIVRVNPLPPARQASNARQRPRATVSPVARAGRGPFRNSPPIRSRPASPLLRPDGGNGDIQRVPGLGAGGARLLELGVGAMMGMYVDWPGRMGRNRPGRPNGDIRDLLQRHHAPPLPDLNYARPAWDIDPEPPAQAKPTHVPPKPAKDGFTRSPQEDDVIVCPGCDNELIAEEVVPENNSKRPSNKKDREVHPFWVVKDCGHVYCNACYQGRKTKTSQQHGGKKRVQCAVDDCEAEIFPKDKWVGVFL